CYYRTAPTYTSPSTINPLPARPRQEKVYDKLVEKQGRQPVEEGLEANSCNTFKGRRRDNVDTV
ncbi:hypothetical protein F443_22635, partial [Phytophthora nicotianae P1569]